MDRDIEGDAEVFSENVFSKGFPESRESASTRREYSHKSFVFRLNVALVRSLHLEHKLP